LLSTLFRSARTATAAAFIYVFASGLIGYLLLQNFVAADKWWCVEWLGLVLFIRD
jgi:hypothetical protein